MPFVEGENVYERLQREQQFAPAEALRIATAVAGALAYAHKQGVVHRDMKPDNILLSGDEVLVADFGVARAVSEVAEKLTATGMIVGTPTYMSPEQASGDKAIDGRSDIFGLGCVLYEMLAGEPPFKGPNPQATLMRRFMGPPRPLRPMVEIPEYVEAAIVRALAKDPAERFATADEFAERAGGAGGAPRAPPAAAEPRRRRAPAGRAAPACCAAGGAAALGVRGWPRISWRQGRGCRGWKRLRAADPRSPGCPQMTRDGFLRRRFYLAVPLTLARDPSMASARRKFVLRLHLIGLAVVLVLGGVVAVLLARAAGPDATRARCVEGALMFLLAALVVEQIVARFLLENILKPTGRATNLATRDRAGRPQPGRAPTARRARTRSRRRSPPCSTSCASWSGPFASTRTRRPRCRRRSPPRPSR